MWNQYLWPLLVTTDERVRPMSVAISSFTGTGGDIYWDQLMAASVVMLLPVLVLFLFFQIAQHIIVIKMLQSTL